MKIAILSSGAHSAKRFMETAQKRGHEAIMLDYRRCYMEIEERKPDVHYQGERVPRVDVVIPRIAARHTGYGSAIVRQFEMRGTFTTAKSIAIVRTRDKVRTMQLLARDGLPIPKTAVANRPDDIDDLIEQVGGPPVIVKLARSTHGKGVVIAETKKAAKSVIQAFYSINAPILVQEFIEESGGADIRLIVVGGKVVAAMKRQGLDEDFRSNLHMGGHGEPVKTTKEERHLAIRSAKRLGLDIAGVDMIRSNRGPLIIEVNSSPSLQGIEKTTGLDVADIIIQYVEKAAIKKPKKDVIGA
ncbi:30S ribosomal protein S6--L-glutamate ligase [Candidatus Microgenomates bacterium]|nr:30S ribosomal protein S6--L-glutamate ligase [Candidatus Microgenomates bacterium]